ncbi:hypothetical protein JA9_004276 [Meyerozyma sp. JA9]|nr:hypothetical protein JA9_004276 [Meyerozyma sp. JA9]
MSGLLPISTYNLALKPFNPAPAVEEDFPVTIRLTLAAVDPEAVDDKAEPSTLRLLKRSTLFDNDFDEDSEDDEDEDDEDDEEDEEDDLDDEKDEPKKKKASKDEDDDEDEDDEDDEEDDEDDDDEDDEDDEDVSEFVVCTLSPKVQFQQTLDLTITPDEEVYFVVTGSYPIHLTGNYVEHPADEDSEDDYDDEYDSEEYDLTPDEDELLEEQDYDLDDLEDASDVENKIEELVEEDNKKRASDEGEEDETPKKKSKKNKEKSVKFNKELEQGPSGSTLAKKDEKEAPKKEQKKEQKKDQKKDTPKDDDKKDKSEDKKEKKFATKTLLGGVVTEDRKVGKGPTAKSGNKVGIRYIGKLKNGKVFDKNTSGKPFVFGLGKGECIKGFDLGVAGMAVGGERRVIIPPKMGYGSQALPGIPANSELTFDIKLVSLK